MEAADILRAARTIAVYGLSNTPGKSAHDIPLLMRESGYDIVGINPSVTSVAGIPCVPRLADVDMDIDILDVFRPSDQCDAIVDEAIEHFRLHGSPRCVWLQAGITTAHGAERCKAAGTHYVEDSCIYVVHQVYLR